MFIQQESNMPFFENWSIAKISTHPFFCICMANEANLLTAPVRKNTDETDRPSEADFTADVENFLVLQRQDDSIPSRAVSFEKDKPFWQSNSSCQTKETCFGANLRHASDNLLIGLLWRAWKRRRRWGGAPLEGSIQALSHGTRIVLFLRFKTIDFVDCGLEYRQHFQFLMWLWITPWLMRSGGSRTSNFHAWSRGRTMTQFKVHCAVFVEHVHLKTQDDWFDGPMPSRLPLSNFDWRETKDKLDTLTSSKEESESRQRCGRQIAQCQLLTDSDVKMFLWHPQYWQLLLPCIVLHRFTCFFDGKLHLMHSNEGLVTSSSLRG